MSLVMLIGANNRLDPRPIIRTDPLNMLAQLYGRRCSTIASVMEMAAFLSEERQRIQPVKSTPLPIACEGGLPLNGESTR